MSKNMYKFLIVIIFISLIAGCTGPRINKIDDIYKYSFPFIVKRGYLNRDSTTEEERINSKLSKQYLIKGIDEYCNGNYILCVEHLSFVIENTKSDKDFIKACIFSGSAYYLLEDYEKTEEKFMLALMKNKKHIIDRVVFKPEIVEFFNECKEVEQ